MSVWLVHGIREFKPGRQMEPLRTALHSRGRLAEHVSYGPVWLPITNKRAVNAVMEAVQPGDDVVAFSNGAWACHQALELGCPIRHLYLISPALNVRAEFPMATTVTVFHSPGDNTVLLARWYRKAGRAFPWRWRRPHGWGSMGRTGYAGNDPKVENVAMGHGVRHRWYRYPATVESIADRVALWKPR